MNDVTLIVHLCDTKIYPFSLNSIKNFHFRWLCFFFFFLIFFFFSLLSHININSCRSRSRCTCDCIFLHFSPLFPVKYSWIIRVKVCLIEWLIYNLIDVINWIVIWFASFLFLLFCFLSLNFFVVFSMWVRKCVKLYFSPIYLNNIDEKSEFHFSRLKKCTWDQIYYYDSIH